MHVKRLLNIPVFISLGHLNSGKDKMAIVGIRYENVLPWTIGNLKYYIHNRYHTMCYVICYVLLISRN